MPPRPSPTSRRRFVEASFPTATWISVVVFAALARTLAIDRWPGINGDEAWYGVNVQEFLSGGTPFWHTGIGNPLNPIHSGLLLALSTVAGPSAAVLRAPEVLLGLLAVAIAYPLLVGPLGRGAALLATIFLAVSPAAVAYARLGWDPSGTPLVTLLAIGAALRNRPLLALIAIAFGFFIHPTNIFMTPIVAAAWAPHAIDRYRAASPVTRSWIVRAAIAGAIVALPLMAWLAVRVAANPNTSLPSISMVIERLTSPQLWAARAWGFVSLFSGISTAIHIAGPIRPVAANATNVIVALLLVVCIGAGWSALRDHRHARWLLAGLVLAFAGFHVVAMDVALSPTTERYGMFMLVPLVIVLAIAIDAVTARSRVIGHSAAALTAVTLLAVLIGGYFLPLAMRGGDAMTTYRTGEQEPKLAAFQFIAADSRSDSVKVIAEGWWLYWTLRYFAGPNGRIHVEPVPDTNMPGGIRPAGVPEPVVAPPARTYVVVFAGSGFPATLTDSKPVFTASDPIGRPIVEVFAIDSR